MMTAICSGFGPLNKHFVIIYRFKAINEEMEYPILCICLRAKNFRAEI